MFSLKFREKFNVNHAEKPKGRCVEFKSFCEKWNRVAASALATLTFILLLAYVIYTAVSDKTVIIVGPDDDYHSFENYDYNTDLTPTVRDLIASKCSFTSCHMKCNDINSTDELCDYLNAFNKTECSVLNVTLWNMNFSDGSIDNGWLENDTLRPINTFVLLQTNLWNIGVMSFSSNTFKKLSLLTIVDSKMLKLQKYSFLNVPVNIFVFGFTDVQTIPDIDYGDCLLEGMKSTLNELKIFNAIKSCEQIHNLVGTKTVSLNSINSIYFENNNIPQLTDDSFHNVPNLKKLILRNNHISCIDQNVFRNVDYLEILDLSNNDLTTIPVTLMTKLQTAQLYLYQNDWYCNCSLQWLQQLAMATDQIVLASQTFCANLNWLPFESADFGCLELTSTEQAPENHVTSLEITITSTDLMKAIIPTEEPWQSTFKMSSLENRTTILIFYGLYLEMGVYEMSISGDAKNFFLVWYNNENRSEYNSVRDIKGNVVMEGIQLKTSYTLCVIMSPKQDSSPLNCLPPIPEPLPKGPDNQDSQNKLFVGIGIGLILVTAAVTAFATFYYIRQNPQLLVGNKRVVLVNSMTTDAVILPKNYKQQENVKPACEAEYMTPKPEKVITRKEMQGRISESSNTSGISFIATDTPPKTSPRPSLEDKNISDNIYESLPTSEYCKYESKILE